MKNFIRSLMIFFLPPIIWMAVSATFNIYYSQTHAPITENPRIIIMGDSHTLTIDPARLTSAINISQSAEPMVVSYFKLLKIIEYQKPDTIILGFGHHNISGFNDLKFIDPRWADEMFSRTYSIMSPSDLMGLQYSRKSWHKSIFKNILLYPHTDHFRYIGKYLYGNNAYEIASEATIKRHFYHNQKLLEHSSASIKSVELIAELCKKHQIKLFLVATPVHRSYYKLIPESYKNIYTSEKIRLQKLGISTLDYAATDFNDSLYMDADHLRGLGSILFSEKLAEDLKNLK